MEQLGSCTVTDSLERCSSQPWRSVRDRFRGALLGLWLAPTVVAAQPSAEGLATRLSKLAAFSLEQTRVFLQQPHAFDLLHVQIASHADSHQAYGHGAYDSESALWASVPALLRYHDSWQRRLQWVGDYRQHRASARSGQSRGSPSQPLQADTIAQVLVLGDLLELLLRGDRCSPIAGPSQLQERATAGRLAALSATEQQHYRLMLAALWAGISNGLPPDSLQSLSKVSKVTAQQEFIGAALVALRYLESYPISVQMAARQGGTAPLVTAVIAGARSGRAAIPALWQILPQCPEILATADDLFALWAGIAR